MIPTNGSSLAAPAAGSADTQAAPRMPASSLPSAGRSQIAARLPAGSAPPRKPLVAPARIVPPASSLRPPLPLPGKWAIAAGFLLRRNRSTRLLREGFSLRRLHTDYYLANAGQDTRAIQLYLGRKNIQHTVRYTELASGRFKDFWKD